MTEPNITSELSVLYVDDEAMALKYFRRALGREVEVLTATSVDEALTVLNEQGSAIAVLVTDQRMPGKNGVELLRKVRRDWPHIMRLLTTAYSDLDDAIDAVNRGEIFRYITKPWDIKLLRAEIRQAMEVFYLRREHDLLMREKLSVWQRMIGVNRVRDLVIMAGSLTHLHNAPAAIEAFLRADAPGHEHPDVAASQALDLWGLIEREITRSLEAAASLIAMTDQHGHDTTRLDSLLDGAGLSPAAGSDAAINQHVQLNTAHGEQLIGGLAAMVPSEGVSVSVSPAELDGLEGWSVALTGETAEHTASPDVPASRAPLAAYLIAHHYGGRIQRGRNQVVASLPFEPANAPAQELNPGWLEDVLVAFEAWE